MKSIISFFIGISISSVTLMPLNSIAKPVGRHSLRGIRIGDTESQVYRQLGKAIRYTESRGGCGIDFSKVLTFPLGKVWLAKSGNEPFTVTSISSQNRKWKTERGIKVGDNIDRAKKYYKFNMSVHTSSNWLVDGSKGAIYLKFKTNKANEIVEITLTGDFC